jgi:hypothetical protein
LFRSGNKNKQTHSSKNKSTRSYEICHSLQGSRQAHEDPDARDEHFYNKCSKNYGLGGLEVQTYIMRRCQFMSEKGKRMQEWLKESLPEVWEKEVCPPSSPNNRLLD